MNTHNNAEMLQPSQPNPLVARFADHLDATLATLTPEKGEQYLLDWMTALDTVAEAHQLIDTLPSAEDRSAMREAFKREPLAEWLPLARMAVAYDQERRKRSTQDADA